MNLVHRTRKDADLAAPGNAVIPARPGVNGNIDVFARSVADLPQAPPFSADALTDGFRTARIPSP